MADNIDINSLLNNMRGNSIKQTNDYKNYDPNHKRKKNNANNYGSNNNRGKSNPFNGNNNRGNNGNRGTGYIGAPYNFVSFSKDVYAYDEDKKKNLDHSKISTELKSGEISYTIEAMTPIAVDDGEGKFYADERNQYAIPGSTMRGLIRSNAQILGLSSMCEDIDDYNLMYRNVTVGPEKKRYNTVLGTKPVTVDEGTKSSQITVLTNVKAGYLVCEGGKYKIYQTVVDQIKPEWKEMNYYPLSEKKIINDYLELGEKKFSYGFFRQNGKNIMQHEFERPFHNEYKQNTSYTAYARPVSYEVKNLKNITAVGFPGTYSKSGYVVSSGKMNKKKVLYIVPAIDKGKDPIEIPDEDIRAFKIDYENKKNTLKRFGEKYFRLPEQGDEIKPVFYIQLDGRLYFGFTPRLRVFYDHTIKDGVPACHKDGMIDYAKAIFGYANSKDSFNSKVSFSDAVITENRKPLPEASGVLGGPKASSYCDYLKPVNGAAVTYNQDCFELRGAKQYWMRKNVIPLNAGNGNLKTLSHFTPLPKGTKFAGKVRFDNLTEDELGLLLWSMKLNNGCWMNVGKAKSYGYGAISLKLDNVKIMDYERAYSLDAFELEPFETVDEDEMIHKYKETVNVFLGKRKIDDLPHIKEFFKIKNPDLAPEKDKIRYMELKEYQSRKVPLQTIDDLTKK